MRFAVGLAIISAVTGMSFSGCANAKFYRGTDLALAPDSIVIHAMPTVAQTDQYSCGPACLASVALYYDVPITTVEQVTSADARREQALSAAELIRTAESFGLVAFGYQGSLDDLRDNLRNNRPVIALLDAPPRVANYPAFEWISETSTAFVSQPHWVVVFGLRYNGDVIIHDPNKGLLTMSSDTFDKQWHKQSRLAVLVGRKI